MVQFILKTLWRKLGSIHVTVVVCLLLVIDLSVGSICLRRHTDLFQPMNDVGLWNWMQTYGLSNPAVSGWFFVLLILLTFLVINTFVCTTDRVAVLLRGHRHSSRSSRHMHLVFRLAPHVIHYAVIVMLAGYLCSYLLADVLPGRTLVPGASLSLPGTTARITYASFDPSFYTGDRLAFFNDWVIEPNIRLTLSDGKSTRSTTIAFNQPVRFNGYGIFLQDFNPRKKGGMAPRYYIRLCLRKDPGVYFYFAGMLLFTLGLVLYLYPWLMLKRNKGVTP